MRVGHSRSKLALGPVVRGTGWSVSILFYKVFASMAVPWSALWRPHESIKEMGGAASICCAPPVATRNRCLLSLGGGAVEPNCPGITQSDWRVRPNCHNLLTT